MKLKAEMDLDFGDESKFETSLDQNMKKTEDQFSEPDIKIEAKDEFVVEENPIINPNEADGINRCFDNEIKEEVKNSEANKECKFHIKDETIDGIEHEVEVEYQKLIKSEELTIKHEEDDSVEPDDVDICSECTVIVAVNDHQVPMGTVDRAAHTVPKGTLALMSSDSCGLGIYSRRHLKQGVRLGPYEGSTTKVESTGGYSWKLRGGQLNQGLSSRSPSHLVMEALTSPLDTSIGGYLNGRYRPVGKLLLPASKRPRQQKNAPFKSSQTTKVDSAWVIELQKKGVAAKEKMANAAMIVAEAKKMQAQNHEKLLKVLQLQNEMLELIKKMVDASEERSSNYMRYINYAQKLSEQNLVAVQCKGELYYRTSRDIEKGEELLIYFDNNPDESYCKPNEENLEEEFYICQFCRLGLKFEDHRDRHQRFCKIRTDESHFGTLCKHLAISSDDKHVDEETEIGPAKSTRNYVYDFSTYGSNQKSDLDRGKGTSHKRGNPIQCSECSYVTYWKSNMSKHKLTHQQKNIQCTDCSYKTNSKNLLNIHSLKHRSVNIFKCEHCNYQSDVKSNFLHHSKKYHYENAIKCTDCDFITYNESYLRIHRRKHEVVKKFKCANCNFQTSYRNSLKSHRLKHESTYLFTCAHCDFKSHDKYLLNIHRRNKHKLPDKFKNDDLTHQVQCTDCDYKSNCKYLLNRHKLKHQSTNIFKCEHCNYKNNVKRNLDFHMKKHDQKNAIKCPDCDFVTYCKSRLDEHRQKHATTKMFKCADCDFQTAHKRSLTIHRQKHDWPNSSMCAH